MDNFQQLALIKPTTQNKETFQYNNQVIVAAGYIAAHAAEPNKPMEQAYTALMGEKVFKPMGMNETTFVPKGHYAFPHSTSLKGTAQVLTLQEDEHTDFSKPSGGIWSNAHDMALYMITELNKGVNSTGKRVFDEHNLMHRRKPQVQMTHDSYYGLGWVIEKRKGLTQIWHTGGTHGFASLLEFFPQKHCGFIILANRRSSGSSLIKAIDAKIIELWFGTDEQSSKKLDFFSKQAIQQAEGADKGWSEPNPEWMKGFLGKHINKEAGIFEIKEDNGSYILDAGPYKTKLMTRGSNDQKTLVLLAASFIGEMLAPTKDGSFKMTEGQHTYVFKKME